MKKKKEKSRLKKKENEYKIKGKLKKSTKQRQDTPRLILIHETFYHFIRYKLI